MRTIFARGAAGVGKTTFCNHYARKLTQNDQWAIVVPLRLYRDEKKPITDAQIWCDTFGWKNSDQQEEVDLLIREIERSGTLIYYLLDGYEEIVDLEETQPIRQWLKSVFQKAHVILTSRPRAMMEFSPDRYVEIVGFSLNDIDEYISRFFSDTQNDFSAVKKALKYALETQLHLAGLAKIPIMLELLCWIYKIERIVNPDIILTFTEIYQKMWIFLSKRYLHTKKNNLLAYYMRNSEIEESTKQLKFVFSKLAYRAWADGGNIILKPELVDEIFSEEKVNSKKTDILDDFGLLTAITHSGDQASQLYTFSHLTFQEYFSAIYWVHLFTSKDLQKEKQAKQFLEKYKYDIRYELMWRYVSGLLSGENLKQFFICLQSLPLDYIGSKHVRLLITCVGESGFYDEKNDSPDDWLPIEIKSSDNMLKCSPQSYIMSWFGHKYRDIGSWDESLRCFPKLSMLIYQKFSEKMTERDIDFFASLLKKNICLFQGIPAKQWLQIMKQKSRFLAPLAISEAQAVIDRGLQERITKKTSYKVTTKWKKLYDLVESYTAENRNIGEIFKSGKFSIQTVINLLTNIEGMHGDFNLFYFQKMRGRINSAFHLFWQEIAPLIASENMS